MKQITIKNRGKLRMEKIKRLLSLLFQLLSLAALLVYLSHGGLSVVLGPGVIEIVKNVVRFGVGIMTISGILAGVFLPTRRQRVFKAAEWQNVKYIWLLILYQTLMCVVTLTSGVSGGAMITKLPSLLMNVVLVMFAVTAFTMPIKYISGLFNLIKTVEYRDPRNLIRQIFS
jgi:hypothetical protein